MVTTSSKLGRTWLDREGEAINKHLSDFISIDQN